MKKLERLFGETKMGWKETALFAALIGIYTGIIALIRVLDNTSFHDISVSYECWVVLALIVITNQKKPAEAAIKCFVFFLISQPLCYLVQLPFERLTWEFAKMYYLKIWFPVTLATLPGGFIAWFCKKQNVLGGIILGIGMGIMGLMMLSYGAMLFEAFPQHLLTVLFCNASMILLPLAIQKKTAGRVAAIATGYGLTAVFLVYIKMSGLSLY